MKIETIIQNCRTNIVIGQPGEGKITEINKLSNPPLPRIIDIEESVELSGWDYLNATTAGHIGYFAGNPEHAGIQEQMHRVLNILDITYDEFTPINKDALLK